MSSSEPPGPEPSAPHPEPTGARADARSKEDPAGTAADPALEAELLACLEAEKPDEALDEVCARRPGDAEKLRKVWARMQFFGLDPSPSMGSRTKVDELPRQVGPFEVLEKLGEGGMGVVYRCRQANPEREVAVKVVRPELLHFEGKRARFDREILATAKLSHPNIVPVLEVGEDGLVPYFSMEYVVGASLAQILAALRRDPPASRSGALLFEAILSSLPSRDRAAVDAETNAKLPIFSGTWIDAIVSIATQVAAALEHAHAREVLHRDIKPSNIMITPDGRALVVDFGLARVSSGSAAQALTQSTSSIGSLPYMPPEALRGDEIDARVDVYGLAVTLYEALAGHFAFVGPSIEATRANVLQAKAPPLRTRNPNVAWDLETVCATAMAPEGHARYPSMRAFREDLDRLRARLPIAARRPGAFLRLRRWQQRNPAASVGIATAVVLAMLAGFALYFLERDARLEQERLRREAERVLYVSKLQRAQSELQERNVRNAVELLNECDAEHRSYAWKHLKLHSDASIQSWQVAEDRALSRPILALSRDNRYALYTSETKTVEIAKLQIGRLHVQLEKIARVPLDFYPDHADIDPQGKRAVISSHDGRHAVVFELSSGKVEHELEAPDQSAFQACFGPKGQRLYTACADGRIAVRDRASAEILDDWPAREVASEVDCRLAISPSRDYLVTSSPRSYVSVWRLDGSEVSRIEVRASYAPHVSFGRNDREILVTGAHVRASQTFVQRHRMEDGSRIQAYNLTMATSLSLEHPNQPWVATLGQSVTALDAKHGGVIRNYCGPKRMIGAATFDRRGKLWTLSKDGKLRRWSLSEPSYMSRIPGHRSAVTAIRCVRGGDILVSGDSSGRLLFTEVAKRRRRIVDVCDARTQTILDGGEHVWAVFLDGTTVRYPLDGSEQESLVSLGRSTKLACRVAKIGFLTGHEDKVLRAWSPAFEARPSQDLTLDFVPAAIAARAGLVAVGGSDRLELYRLAAAKNEDAPQLEHFGSLPFKGKASTIAIRADGEQLVVSGRDADVWVHDLPSGSFERVGSHAADTSGLAYLPDARFVASTSWTGYVAIWDVAHLEQRCRVPLFGMYLCMAASPRGDYAALGNIDTGIHVMWFEKQ